MKLERSVIIHRPTSDVFAYVTDPENARQFRQGLIKTEVVNDMPMGIGCQLIDTVEVLGRQTESQIDIVAYQKDQKRAMDVKLGPLPISFTEVYQAVEGGTKLSIQGETKVKGPQALMVRAAKGQIARQLEQELAAIKRILEATDETNPSS